MKEGDLSKIYDLRFRDSKEIRSQNARNSAWKVLYKTVFKKYVSSEMSIIDLESLDAPLSVPQIAIEFHHFCIPERTLSESMKWTELLKSWGYTAYDFGSWAGRSRKLPKYTSLNSDLNVEILFIKEGY